ncbi:MAG: lipoyl(octanoyl) transferase LipB [Gammaproteobacteria bacterium]|nr:lipoyl(octanoyl) transferase LipB [Gammaproteobacteria bacterium]MCZ6911474.1 lipoyl(octanoyl) transferase LipB [Pseudomonadota bacterium]
MNQPGNVVIKRLGLVEYEPTWRDMQTFTDRRDAQTADEIWLLQHPPVYTLGLNGNPEHLLAPADIPVINIDRGGQVTYHGPGQLVVYPLIDLRRQSLGVRELVSALEQSIIDLATDYGIEANSRADAPGVYVDGRKLASLGLRIRRGCSYHGLAFNIDMDLEPFSRINPCGFEGLEVTQLKDLGGPSDPEQVAVELEPYLLKRLKYKP